MSLSIQGLKVFLAILERGSLSAAARELGLTQPAVSNHLRALEQRFGISLLSRGPGLKPTPAGGALAEHAERVLSEISDLEEEMARHADPHGRLVVGASTTPGEFLLPGLAADFHGKYPEVSLDLRISDTDETIQALLEREVEIAFVGRRVEDAQLDELVVEEEELVLIVASGDPFAGAVIGQEELADRPFVMRERGSGTRRTIEEGLLEAGIDPHVSMELGSNAAVMGAVAAGSGVGAVPAKLVGRQNSVATFTVRGLGFRRPFVRLVEHDRPLSPAAEAFMKTSSGEGYP